MLIVLLVSVFGFKSVEAIAWGYAISAWIDVVIISIPTKKLVGYGIFEQISDVWRIVLASALMGGVVFLVGLISAHVLVVLALQCIAGILSYLALCYILKIDCFIEIVNIILQKLKKRA